MKEKLRMSAVKKSLPELYLDVVNAGVLPSDVEYLEVTGLNENSNGGSRITYSVILKDKPTTTLGNVFKRGGY